jgi:hypothetical protein
MAEYITPNIDCVIDCIERQRQGRADRLVQAAQDPDHHHRRRAGRSIRR